MHPQHASAGAMPYMDQVSVEPARRDIFVPVQQAQQRAPLAISMAEPTPMHVPQPPAEQQLSPPSYRFLGMFVSPEGTRHALLAHGDSSHWVQAGAVLPDAITVEALEDRRIVLKSSRSGMSLDVIVPPPPDSALLGSQLR